MNIVGKRLIAYLKADTTLTNLLGSVNNIFAMGLQEGDNRKDKFVVVSISLGEDGNSIPMQSGEITIEAAVNRKVADGFTLCADIANRVDSLLNKKENLLATSEWKILHFMRTGSPSNGIMIDERSNEYYFTLEYEFILDESV
jgi:hypothetical protein